MRRLLTPRWILTTLLVIAGVAVLARLGLWQLERLEQRRAFNQQVAGVMALSELDLNTKPLAEDELIEMGYRQAVVRGEFMHDEAVLLRNQTWEGELGYHLLTPLQIEGRDGAILVNRGWIPYEEGSPDLKSYEVEGPVTLRGMIMIQPEYGRFGIADPELPEGQTRLAAWNQINLERIGQQTSAPLLPVYLQAAPSGDNRTLPRAFLPAVELTEGSHMGYALQWFAFASILGLGYPFFVRRQLKHPVREENSPARQEL